VFDRLSICCFNASRRKEHVVTQKLLFVTTAAILFVGATLVRTQSADQALDPIKVAPDTHKIAFENAFVRVLEVRVPAGKTEPRHRHPHGLSVYLTDWEVKVTVDGKPPQVSPRKRGTVAWSDAVVHTVENVGKTEGHIMRIELKH
jgi:quercetin dioxygenase-like cupin family protein